MSLDPTLAPAGQVFARVTESFGQFVDTRAGPTGDAAAGVRSLFSHGTPIRIRDVGVEPSPGRMMIERRGDAACDHRRYHGSRDPQSQALSGLKFP